MRGKTKENEESSHGGLPLGLRLRAETSMADDCDTCKNKDFCNKECFKKLRFCDKKVRFLFTGKGFCIKYLTFVSELLNFVRKLRLFHKNTDCWQRNKDC